eukprot:2372122-Rhodomonas_salina.1
MESPVLTLDIFVPGGGGRAGRERGARSCPTRENEAVCTRLRYEPMRVLRNVRYQPAHATKSAYDLYQEYVFLYLIWGVCGDQGGGAGDDAVGGAGDAESMPFPPYSI